MIVFRTTSSRRCLSSHAAWPFLVTHTFPALRGIQVVRKLLKNCTPPTSADQIPNIDPPTLSPTQRMASPSTRPTTSAAVRKTTRSRPAWIGDETLTGKPSDTPAQDQAQATRVVPLSRLILSGNYVTDMGALTLCPLVEASATLAEIDLRDTFIGRKGELVLKKVVTVTWCRLTGTTPGHLVLFDCRTVYDIAITFHSLGSVGAIIDAVSSRALSWNELKRTVHPRTAGCSR